MQLLVQKWEAVVSIDYSSFDLGVNMYELTYDDRLQTIKDVLGGKSLGTIKQRLAQISKYVKWATSDAKRPPFPATAELIKNHVRHLRHDSASHSRYTSFVEVMKFAKHVMGLDCDISAFETAWVAGILRGAAQARPLRKQSTVPSVAALKHLENFLSDESVALVDRYAAGVFLFAVFARARFGDLRKISSITLDEAEHADGDHLGYLEMSSASHKMRATGNRLGSHLPLVAPLKGVGESSWGKTFISISEKVGLDFKSWTPMCPLLPAPNQMGDWTSRPTTSGEVGKWIKQLLIGCDCVTEGFTPHGCKATTLAMLSKYGAGGDTRLILGHHQTHKGASEVTSGLPVTTVASPAWELPEVQHDEASDAPQIWDIDPIGQGSVHEQGAMTESLEDDLSDSSSSSDSSESCLDDVIEEHAQPLFEIPSEQDRPIAATESPETNYYQHRNSKVVHMLSFGGTSFLCGRQLTADYRKCSLLLVAESMKCQQCKKRYHRFDRNGQDDTAEQLST
eukprot:s2791_g13.t1